MIKLRESPETAGPKGARVELDSGSVIAQVVPDDRPLEWIETNVVLDAESSLDFVRTLLEPPPPTEALRRAFARKR